jgi:hypothetical protein
MKLELNEKTYVAKQPKAKMFRKALVLTKENDLTDLNPELLDEVLSFVCEVFNDQFTIDDIYDNIDSDEISALVQNTLEFVIKPKEAPANAKKK